MAKRKEVSQRIILDDGRAVNVRIMDGILVDDLVIQGMKAEGYRVMTGRDAAPVVSRKTKDYLIRTGVIPEE